MRKFRQWVLIAGVALGGYGLTPGAAAGQALFEVGGGYTYVRANAPAGGCGCFSLNGGNGWLAFNATESIAVVGEVGVQHASNVVGTGADLTLTSYLFGPRYTVRRFGRLQPFAQVLLGGAHASGSLAPGSSGLEGSANAFATIAGGGLDVRLSEHFSLRAFEADYYFTKFGNGVNDRENNLRIGAGIIFRFGSR
jgi:outer membrane immunogenic protein